MNSAEFRRLQKHFEAAVGLSETERDEYVGHVSEAEPEISDALKKMLFATESDGGVLTRVVASALGGLEVETGATLRVGIRLGDYRIVSHLATGGMAHVYLAERADSEFEKTVAIKVIQNGLWTANFEQRFLVERQILACLEHPNCCRLIDGGVTPAGMPYLVMEYVDGASITEYAAHRQLDLESKLRLFGQLCSAVEYVHSNLIIHRDIKPSNVLVTNEGILKLMDFGIAKLLDPHAGGTGVTSDLTGHLDRLATPGYASPEQLRGEPISTASDVYSLGLVLEELSTGAKRCREGEAGWLPLPKDLRAIIQRATHADAARRYRFAGQLAEDVRRYLDGYPVQAKPDSWWYRARMFAGRNSAAVVAGGLAVCLLIAGLLSTLREQRRTKQRFDEVRNLATVFLFEFDATIQDLAGATTARQKVVNRALKSLETLSRDSEGDGSLQKDLAAAYHKVSRIQWSSGRPNLGDRNGAVESLQKELAIRERLARAAPNDVENLGALASAFGTMSATLEPVSATRAEEYAAKARALFATLERRFAGDPQVLSLAATNHSHDGLSLHKTGKLQEALGEQRRAIALQEEAGRRMPEDAEQLRYLGWYHLYASDVLGGGGAELHLGDRKGALAEAEKALEIFRKIAQRSPTSGVARRDVHAALMRMAGVREFLADYEGAIRIRSEVSAEVDELMNADPRSSESARDSAVAHSSLGGLLAKAGQLDEAERELSRAEGIDQMRMSRFPQDGSALADLASVQHKTGEVKEKRGRLGEAANRYKEAIATRAPLLVAEPGNARLFWRQAATYEALGKVLAKQGNDAAGMAALEAARQMGAKFDGKAR